MTSIRQRTGTTPPPRTPSSIRPFHWTDIPALRRLRGETARLDMPEGIVGGLRPVRSTVFGILPWHGGIVTLVLLQDNTPCAFVQGRPRRDGLTWDVLYLAYGRKDRIGSGAARDAMWSALLDALTRQAGRRRATRLFARVPDNAEAMIALRDAGYMTYGRETLYVGPYHKGPRATEEQPTLRRQQRGDTWAIHQLYTLTTPKAMQFAEARTSGYWDLPRRGTAYAGYWAGDAHEVTAYARAFSGDHTHVIDIMFRPERCGDLAAFVRAVLAALPAGEGDLVYIRAYGHQEDLGSALLALGFAPLVRQSLLVKYTTIPVREAAPAFVPAPVLRRLAAGRVPSPTARWLAPLRLWRRIPRFLRPSPDGELS